MEISKNEPIKSMADNAMEDSSVNPKKFFPNLVIVGMIGVLIIFASLFVFLNPQLLGTSSPATVVLVLGVILGLTDVVFAVYVYRRLQKTAKDVDAMLKTKFSTPEVSSSEKDVSAA